MSKLGLYIHIPFCESKCSYCDFVSFCGQEKRMEEYVEALIGEMRLYSGKFAGKEFDTVYIGGGTPSVLPAHAVEKIVTAVRENFVFSCHSEADLQHRQQNVIASECVAISRKRTIKKEVPFQGILTSPCQAPQDDINSENNPTRIDARKDTNNNDIEITIEVNPRSLTEEKLNEYLRVGVNRISLGVQCMNDAVLKTIGRVQTVADVEKAFALLKRHGVENISADLMLGLPNETYADIDNTLNFFATHGVKHISAYGLQIESGTPLARQIETGVISVPDEDETTNQYEHACARMRELGFIRYEISNFAKVETNKELNCSLPRDPHGDKSPQDDITKCHCEEQFCVTWQSRGSEPYVWISKHNSKYWDGTEYLGLGVSASGYFNNMRYTNTKNLDEYINKISEGKLPIDYIETLSKEQRREERIMLTLRTEHGLELDKFTSEFGENLLETKKEEIEKLLKAGLIEIKGNVIRINDDKVYISNSIITELI